MIDKLKKFKCYRCNNKTNQMKSASNSLKLFRILFFPLCLFGFILDTNLFNQEIYANKKLKPAREEDLYLYKGMGASYLCIASKAGIEFPKAIGVATATYVQVLEGKHGGLIKELGDTKLERKKLIAGAEFQIVETALRYCPESIPEDVTKKVNEILIDNQPAKKNKNKKK
tara:strand:+ start:20 stop:532 length:513 start_codon:yes stop_codon:yes gene_type:complete